MAEISNSELRELMLIGQTENDRKFAQIMEMFPRINLKIERLNGRIDNITTGITTRRNTMPEQRGEDNSHNRRGDQFTGCTSFPGQQGHFNQGGGTIPRYNKLYFPTFNGLEDPLIWLRRCEKKFSHQRTTANDILGLAAFHLLGEAQLWYNQIELDRLLVDWAKLKELYTLHFGPPAHSNHLGDLVLLHQTGSVELYQKQFQEKLARSGRMVRVDQQVNLFTIDLNESLRLEVELHAPVDLARSMNLARALELRQEVQHRRPTWQGEQSTSSTLQGWRNTPPQAFQSVLPPPRNTPANTMTGDTRSNNPPPQYIKKLTSSEMVERRSKNLCYNCDEQYRAGHQCKRLFWHEVDEADNLDDTEEMIEEEPPKISLHAITRQKSPKTMQIRAQVLDRELVGLVDSEITHNFVSLTTAQHLQLQILPHPTATVSVANGEKVPSYRINKAVNFSIGTTLFHAEFFVIPLAGFDMVLGVKWLQTLGPILWGFSTLTMSFVLHGSQVLLQGSLVDKPHYLHSMTAEDTSNNTLDDNLIDEFSDLFHEPSGLPPLRQCDHRIYLKPGSDVVVIRPYRYRHLQKDEIERQCQAMLQQGLIRSNSSLFSSPVLIMKKHDGTWRFLLIIRN
ncbi:uncharacterized protein [Aristolochia californica]|uniref:uncharacterized protein n=1 Tax=Aristolochia californica TaxID=171875 RepID=UPI0035DB1A37